LIYKKLEYYKKIFDKKEFIKSIYDKKDIWLSELNPFILGKIPEFEEVKKYALRRLKESFN